MGLTKKLRFLDQYLLWNSLLRFGSENSRSINLLDGKETLNKLITENLSFARFGEGELRLAFLQGDTVYEELDRKKAKKLREILFSNNELTLIGFNNLFSLNDEIMWITKLMRTEKKFFNQKSIHHKNDVTILKREKLTSEYRAYLAFIKSFTKIETLGEASCFSLGTYVEDYSKRELESVRKLIIDVVKSERTLVISPENSHQDLNSLIKLFRETEIVLHENYHINIPSHNAFSEYRNILKKIQVLENKVDLILVQGGALATILAYEIPKIFGIRCIDVGVIKI